MIQEVKERVKALLTDVICQVCTKEVPHKSQIQIEGTLCITSDSHPTFAIQIAQLLSKAEPLTIQNLSKPLYTPSLGYGNGQSGPPGGSFSTQQSCSQSGNSSGLSSQQSPGSQPGNNYSTGYFHDAPRSAGISMSSQAPPSSLSRSVESDKISPVNKIPPITEIPRRLTQPGETKHYIHPIKRRRLSSEPSLEMRPPPDPPRRRESDSSMLERSRYQTSSTSEDPEEIYQNVQRNARLVIKKVNMSEEAEPHIRSVPSMPGIQEHSSPRSSPSDVQSMQTLKAKLIGQPMVLRMDDSSGRNTERQEERNHMMDEDVAHQQYRSHLERRHSEVLPNELHHEHRALLDRLHRRDSREKRISECSETPVWDKPEGTESTGQNVKDKVRSFLYKREKSVERLVERVSSPTSRSGAILCHSASAPSLSALASAASTATPAPVPHDVKPSDSVYQSSSTSLDPNIPTDLSRKSSVSFTGSSSSVIREMLQNYRGSHDVYNLMSSEHVPKKLDTMPSIGKSHSSEHGVIVRQALHDILSMSSNDGLQKVMEMERSIQHGAPLLSPDGSREIHAGNNAMVSMVTSNYEPARGVVLRGDSFYDTQQSESMNKLNAMSRVPGYPKYFLTTVGSQVVPVTIVPSSRGLSTITEAQGLEPIEPVIGAAGDGDPTSNRLTTLAPLRPTNLQQLGSLPPNDVRSLYGTTYRLTPLSPAATTQPGQYTIFQRSESVKSDSCIETSSKQQPSEAIPLKSEPDAGLVCGSTGRVKELDLGQMTKETINGLIIVDEESHKTISPQDYIYKDESTGETQVRACEYCGKHFKYFSKLMEHIRSHTKQKPYKCSICGRTYTYKGDLTVHIRQHSSSKPFVCECGRAFASKKYLSVHQSQARIKGRHAIPKEGERSDVMYDCKLCDKRFRFQSSFDMHMAIHEANNGGTANDTGEFTCSTCGKVFKYLNSYDLHLQLHQSPDDDIKQETDGELYECQACNTCFKDHSLFVEHVLEHEKSKEGTSSSIPDEESEIDVVQRGENCVMELQQHPSSPLVAISANPLPVVASRISLPENLQTRFPMLASIASSQIPVNISMPTTTPCLSAPSLSVLSPMPMPGGMNIPLSMTNSLPSTVISISTTPSASSNVRLTASAQLRCLSEMATNAQTSSDVSAPKPGPALTESTQYSQPSVAAVQLSTISGVGVQSAIEIQPTLVSGVGLQQSTESGVRSVQATIIPGVGVQRHELPLSLVRTSVTQNEADSTNTAVLDSPINKSGHIE